MRRNPTVLIAEDHEDTRRVYSIILRHYGYQVEEARSGLEAVELARTVQPQLVLMDIGLPVLDGFEASRMLKSSTETAGVPVIAFSARVDSTADLGGGATFDGFILKPIGPKELVQRVDAYMDLLGVERPDPAMSSQFDGYEDPDGQTELMSS